MIGFVVGLSEMIDGEGIWWWDSTMKGGEERKGV